jgi:peptide methionine sulfoxide reductase MsrA
MKPLRYLIALMLAVSFSPVKSYTDIFDELAVIIKNGDARQISRYFGSNVDLTILNIEEVYSKAQAEQILKDFFAKNPAKSFTIIHKGLSKEGSKYAIGSYVSVQGTTYRTYLFVKNAGGNEIVQELRFEKD